ncbi:MAG: DUF1345 domain-containing protein [Paracoccus sp.]|nr:DUF1345 domain-containing protein [Paracoccus sp. (in: a-proteobacteria)]
MRGVWRRHSRFLVALAVGALAVLVAPRGIIDRALLGADLFFAVYLAASGLHARHLTAGDLRRHGREDDEGAGLIVALAVAAIALSLSAVIGALGTAKGQGSALQPLLAVLSVPLGVGHAAHGHGIPLCLALLRPAGQRQGGRGAGFSRHP